MKKHWLTAIIMAVLLLAQAVAACGGALAEGEEHVHTPSGWKHDEFTHWRDCTECGKTLLSEVGEHVLEANDRGTYSCVCGYEEDQLYDPDTTQWVCDEMTLTEFHYQPCKVCRLHHGNIEGHDYLETPDSSGNFVCEKCGYKRSHIEHKWSNEWTAVPNEHFHVCEYEDCNVHDNETAAAHTWQETENGTYICTTCGYEIDHEHEADTDWTYNADNHWHACTHEGCEWNIDFGVHTIVNGKCSVCEYEKPHEHNWKAEWKYDATNHWHGCKFDGCEEKYDEAEHTWGEWIAEGTFHERECTVCHRVQHENHDLTDGKCEICGFTMHGAQDEWKYDEHTHWHECKFAGCEEKFNEEQHVIIGGKCKCGYEQKHEFSDEWSSDETHHWHACTVEGCGWTYDEAEHTWGEWIAEGTFHERECTVCHRVQHENHDLTDGKCEICGFTMHGAQDEWKNDENTHWHGCKFDGCEEKYDEAEHTWGEWIAEGTFHERECTVCHRVQHENHDLTDGKCDICGFTMHGAQDEWKNDEHTHWHECKFDGCKDKFDENEHDFVNGVCSVCGYRKIEDPVYDDVQPVIPAPLPPQTGDASYLAIGIGMIAAALCIALRKRQSN